MGHIFNNYYKNTISNTNVYSIASRFKATIRVENNYFEGIKGNPLINVSTDANPGFFSGVITNTNIILPDCGPNKIKTAPSDWIPPYEYQSVLTPVTDVPAVVMARAGAQ